MLNALPRLAALLYLALISLTAPLSHAADKSTESLPAGTQEMKIVFDIAIVKGENFLRVLETVDDTRKSLLRSGVTPHFVLAFRGGSTRLVQTDLSKVPPAEQGYMSKIAAKLKELHQAPGLEGMEQCGLAIRGQETNPSNVLPEVKVVENGWISIAGYQAKGYAYIAP